MSFFSRLSGVRVYALVTLNQSLLTEIFFSWGIERTVLYQPVYNTRRQTHEKETLILDKIWKRINNNKDEFCVETELCQGNPVLVPLASRTT